MRTLINKVYVVCYTQSYDGWLYDSVFSSEEKAKAYIKKLGSVGDLYAIHEEELDSEGGMCA